MPKRLHIRKSAKIDLDNVLTMNIWSRVSIYLIGFGSLNLVFIPKNSIFIKNTLLLKKKKLNTAEVKILNRNKADLNGTDSEEWNYKNIERLKTWHFLVFQLERKIRLVLIQKLIINLCQCEPYFFIQWKLFEIVLNTIKLLSIQTIRSSHEITICSHESR